MDILAEKLNLIKWLTDSATRKQLETGVANVSNCFQ